MSNIDPAADMTWARTVPTFGTTQPIYPTFNPPQFDAAKAYEAANSVMAGKLGNQIRQNEIQQEPTQNAIQKELLQKYTADNVQSMSDAKRQAYISNLSVTDAAVSAVDDIVKQQPQGQSEDQTKAAVDAEIDRQVATLKARGVSDDQIKAFKDGASSAEARAHWHAVAEASFVADQRARGGASAGRDATIEKDYRVEESRAYREAYKAAMAQSGGTPEKAAAAGQAAADNVRAGLEGGSGFTLPAKPAPTPLPADVAPGWVQRNMPEALGGLSDAQLAVLNNPGGSKASAVDAGAAAIKKGVGEGVAGAQKARSIQVAGKPAATPPTETKPEDQTTGNGTSVAPFTYTGPEDDDAKHKWAASIPAGKAFKSPWTGNTLYKGASGEADSGAE